MVVVAVLTIVQLLLAIILVGLLAKHYQVTVQTEERLSALEVRQQYEQSPRQQKAGERKNEWREQDRDTLVKLNGTVVASGKVNRAIMLAN